MLMTAARHKKQTHPTKKRHGHHQRRSKDFLKTYWPYMPTLLVLIFGLAVGIGWWQPAKPIQTGVRGDVLAYATNVNASGLLSETNAHRTSHGRTTLSLNNLLSQAAQAKANDMATRNYWSHNTPEGNPPWIFVDQVGYAYQKAGENLAYGFATSSDTVTGWMNSASHRDNMLDSAFSEVGFGMANSENYQGNGPQTIVVAMYARPTVAAATTAPQTPSPAPAPAAAPSVASSPSTTAPSPESTPSPQETPVPEETPEETIRTVSAESRPSQASTAIPTNNTTRRVSWAQVLTNGSLPWIGFALSILSTVLLGVFALRHTLAIKKALKSGERFLLKHPLFDFALACLFTGTMLLNVPAGTIL